MSSSSSAMSRRSVLRGATAGGTALALGGAATGAATAASATAATAPSATAAAGGPSWDPVRFGSSYTARPPDPGAVLLGGPGFAVHGDGEGDDTAALQAAVDEASRRASPTSSATSSAAPATSRTATAAASSSSPRARTG
ncbi:hypothetical protein [Streptomyces sp. CMB-StM0423]|uniref:hypothetical protein n=1 Tax=Streptomyces sp. CMB-StM0423 TaxID=2059884 RepID=UPI001F40B354|nr:hypothetical protein [Streptomyces sp. CMB-StM0423]